MQTPSDLPPPPPADATLGASASAAAAQTPSLDAALASLDLGSHVDGVEDLASAGSSTVPPEENKSKSKNKKRVRGDRIWTQPTSRRRSKKSTQPAAGQQAPPPPPPLFVVKGAEECAPGQPVLLSRVFKSERVELSGDCLTAGSAKGYRMVRATHGVAAGAWYFEVKVLHLGPTGHARLGWATKMADLEGPVGYDAYSFGYRDIDGAKVHKAWRDVYADEGYGEGDVLGFYISLPDGERYEPEVSYHFNNGKPSLVQLVANSNQEEQETLPHVPGSEICYFKNGVCQGSAFRDISGGRYFPAASMYTLPNEPNCLVKFNFGPDFEFFPQEFGGLPIPQPMSQVAHQATKVKNDEPAEDFIAKKSS